MLKRKIYNTLLEWKNTKDKECLLLKGARQVGKTFIVEKFGSREYKSFIELNFFLHPEYAEIFAGALDAATICERISYYLPKTDFIEHNTLIFLDEIQHCPNARTAMKFLALDNRYDVIASGSLLGINYKEIASIPVGYERQLDMYSLDLEEFLWAMGYDENHIENLRTAFENREPVWQPLNEKILELTKKYMVVGGMPEVVNTYIATNNFQNVHKIQKKILQNYASDVRKYASARSKQKIQECFDSVSIQLARENKKFQYSKVGGKGGAEKYRVAIEWLEDAGLVKSCYNVSLPKLPLKAYEDRTQFKIYATDIGLLTAMFGRETQVSILKNTLVGPAKGGIYENLIFTILQQRDFSLHYFKNKQSTQEIEFVYESDEGVVPVEVKSRNGSTLSLNTFIKKYKPQVAYKIINGNVGKDGGKVTLPFYMGMFL